MEYDRCFGLSTSSMNFQSIIKSHFDVCIDFEDEIEEDDEEVQREYLCPFCSEDFDLVGLCCHIDVDHPVEARSGVCPLCLAKVGMNLVGHITSQHGSSSKSWHKLKLHKGEFHSTILSLRKELRNGHFQSLLARSSSSVSSSKMAPDPLLSFIYNMSDAGAPESVQPDSTTGEKAEEKCTFEKTLEKNVLLSSLSDEDHVEKAKRCQFVQGLIMSTIMDDGL